jgi:ribosomal protein L7/L12
MKSLHRQRNNGFHVDAFAALSVFPKEYTMPGLTPDQVQKIHQLLHDKQLIQAVYVYREATGVSLAEAREAVEEMARNEYSKPPSGVRNFDDPVLEGKIRSLLSKGKKIEAVKIYRAEYSVSLNEATDAVERIAASMPRHTAVAPTYESAIGQDPFAEEGTNRGRMLVLGAVLSVLLCGLGMLVFILLSNP